MIDHFREMTIGGVLFAPFVLYALAAIFVLFALRPVLRLPPEERRDRVKVNEAVRRSESDGIMKNPPA
jgi:hypothetical protein